MRGPASSARIAPARATPTRGDRRRGRELAEALRALEPGVTSRELLAGPMVELLDARLGGFYALSRGEERVRVTHAHGEGISSATYARDLESALNVSRGPILLYDPTLPEPHQRNSVVELCPGALTVDARALLRRHGMDDCWQLRVLACEGPSLLAWVGALRPAAFTRREHLLLRALTPAIRARLRLERQVGDAPLALSALPVVLEAVGAPALVLTSSGAVLLANSSARALLAQDRRGLLEALRASAAGHGAGRFAITRLAFPGCPVRLLAVLRPELADPGPRATAFAARYALTARQAEVVALAVRGFANKTIAAQLRCAESTVEMHVTAVFARTQVASRSELVARFWSERG